MNYKHVLNRSSYRSPFSLRCFLHRSKWVVIACILLALSMVQGTAAPQKPNIIVIFTDDMGYADVGCYGGKFAPTPNIDQLAKEGTRFTQFYVASPICSPSRAGLMTGMYPARSKIRTFLQSRRGNEAAGQEDYLDANAPSMVRTLKEAGYATAHIGKWHLGGGRDVTNAPSFPAYGYDEYVSTYESPDPDPLLTSTNWIWAPVDTVKRWDRTAYFVDKTLDFLNRKKDQPCFVNFWPDDVHTPWIPEGTTPRIGKKNHTSQSEFEKVLAEYDRQIGRLMAGLKKRGLDTNTIVIFTSDNGPGPDFAGNTRSLGMRGQKGSLYEGGIRVPFIVRWPGKTPANQVNETSLFNAVDLFPSLCHIAGASLPKNAKLDGENVSPIFFGKSVSRKHPMYWEFNRNKRPTDPANRNHSPHVAVRDGRWKLLVNEDGSGAELYDVAADPNETENLVKRNQTMTRRLIEAALEWKKAMPSKS